MSFNFTVDMPSDYVREKLNWHSLLKKRAPKESFYFCFIALQHWVISTSCYKLTFIYRNLIKSVTMRKIVIAVISIPLGLYFFSIACLELHCQSLSLVLIVTVPEAVQVLISRSVKKKKKTTRDGSCRKSSSEQVRVSRNKSVAWVQVAVLFLIELCI